MCLAEGKCLSQEAERHYNSATRSKVHADGNMPNVIKAYYVAYLPDPKFVIPTAAPATTATAATAGAVPASLSVPSEVSRKRARYDEADTDRKETIDANNASSSSSNQQNNKIEIFESKKYPGKFYFIDFKTNGSVWVEIIRNNNPNGGSGSAFNARSNVADFHFVNIKNEKCSILKANFAS